MWCVGLELARKMCEKLGEGFAYHVICVSVCQHRSHQKCKAITSKRVTRYTFTLTHLEGRGLHGPPSNFAEKAIRARRVRSCRCLHAQIRPVCTTTADTLQVNPFRVDPFSSGGSTDDTWMIFLLSSPMITHDAQDAKQNVLLAGSNMDTIKTCNSNARIPLFLLNSSPLLCRSTQKVITLI